LNREGRGAESRTAAFVMAARGSGSNLYWKIGAALTEIEKEYGLRELVRDKTAQPREHH